MGVGEREQQSDPADLSQTPWGLHPPGPQRDGISRSRAPKGRGRRLEKCQPLAPGQYSIRTKYFGAREAWGPVLTLKLRGVGQIRSFSEPCFLVYKMRIRALACETIIRLA